MASSQDSKQLKEITIPGTHALLMPMISQHVPPGPDVKVLDLGAGHGAMSGRLLEAGYQVSACDKFPKMFEHPEIECRGMDFHQPLAYEPNTFDLVVCIEVVEHLESQLGLFSEIGRILKPGGVLLFTTPNIASFKSRLSFLFSGYFYAHGPLDVNVDDPVTQHIAAFTPNRYRFILDRAGFDLTTIESDKLQKSSRLLAWMAPLVRWYSRVKHGRMAGSEVANSRAALYARSLVFVAEKRAEAAVKGKAA